MRGHSSNACYSLQRRFKNDNAGLWQDRQNHFLRTDHADEDIHRINVIGIVCVVWCHPLRLLALRHKNRGKNQQTRSLNSRLRESRRVVLARVSSENLNIKLRADGRIQPKAYGTQVAEITKTARAELQDK